MLQSHPNLSCDNRSSEALPSQDKWQQFASSPQQHFPGLGLMISEQDQSSLICNPFNSITFSWLLPSPHSSLIPLILLFCDKFEFSPTLYASLLHRLGHPFASKRRSRLFQIFCRIKSSSSISSPRCNAYDGVATKVSHPYPVKT